MKTRLADPSTKHPLGKRQPEAKLRDPKTQLQPGGKGDPARGYQTHKVAAPKGHPGLQGSARKSK